ncbi:Hsp20/alpha crystallin family protein [Spongiivirga citrea]|uniref:Hsp20 family protein n=1 Tax=Spongiivirga citrea TaxID=1481457 RepID=A0A6M0CD13_9FLAO|nr:Hsp20/alpha crystallin family protein [Spongiivirga citrea]NER15728.1 Hsp20 family protein [Spongiivirga citrea]
MTLLKTRRRRPWRSLMNSQFIDMDDFFEDNFWLQKKDTPALNIKEADDHFEIELAAPGFSKKDFEVTIDDQNLNISAKKSSKKEDKKDGYTRKEFSYDSFERSLMLPESVKQEKVTATYKNGILHFDLAKKEGALKPQHKVIEIQ